MKSTKSSKIILSICSLILSVVISLSIVNILAKLFGIAYPKWISDMLNTWISLFIQLNLNITTRNEIQVLHFVDFVVFVLCGTIYFILFLFIKKGKGIIWYIFSIFGLINFPLGVILLFITHSGGRTGILVASVIFSIFVLLDKTMKKGTGLIGVISSVLILGGCDVLSLQSTNLVVGYIILLGYCCWIIWFILLAKEIEKIRE
jgi:hypothetical protein